jgi:hypothetical protein
MEKDDLALFDAGESTALVCVDHEQYQKVIVPQLTKLIDERIGYLVGHRYTGRRVSYDDVFPAKVDHKPVMEWIVARTLMRPRDAIAFVNEAILQAVGSSRISAKMMREAEGLYSRGRLRALAEEWIADYPSLLRFVDILKGRPSHFRLSEILDLEIEDFCLAVATEGAPVDDLLSRSATAVAEGSVSPRVFKDTVTEVFYKIGLVGLKLERFEGFVWASRGRRSVSSAEMDDETRVAVNPPFWRTLGIRPA